MIVWCSFGMVLVSVSLGAALLAQEAPSPAQLEEAWMKAMTPGKPHQLLAERVGRWDITVKMWMDPSAPPSIGNGVSIQKMILDGRYREDSTWTETNGMPFEGRGIVGYNNLAKHYEYTWIDSMGTAISFGVGTSSEDGNVMTWKTSMIDPVSKQEIIMHSTETQINNNHFVHEMYTPLPDGTMFKTLELDYQRSSR